MDYSDTQLEELIATARYLFRIHRNNMNMEESVYDEALHIRYLRTKRVVKELMQKRRQWKRNCNHIWKVYAESIVAKRLEKENATAHPI